MTKFIVAHHFAPATGQLLAAHPAVGDVRALDLERRWDLPIDADILFVLHDGDDAHAVEAPRPAGWPGQTKLVQIASSGIDGYPEWMFEAPLVATATGTTAGPISEYVLTAMLMHAKRLPGMILHDGDPWTTREAMMERPLGTLDGKTLGLVGIGQIGSRIAQLARAFGMRVLAVRRSDAPGPEGIEIVALDEMLGRADHIVLAAPVTAATTGLLDARAFDRVKPGVHIVNIARGALIDTAALIDALASGRVGGASLDVTDPEPLPPGHPLWAAPNVRITGHVAWSCAGTPARIFKLFAENIGRVAAGQRPLNAL